MAHGESRTDGTESTPAAVTDSLRRALSGRYAVERELGRGGMATVYLARDLRHDRTVAVKVLQRDVVPAVAAERFLREITLAAGLTHPHVLGVHDSGEADGLLYFVMPYVEGETLRAHLARGGALPVSEAVRLLRELAGALAYAHGRGVVHRDLKPENVLLSDGHAVIADFGIAKALATVTQGATVTATDLTMAGVALGTPAYMAPEQVLGDQGIDHRADLYALGIIAYEVLTGAHPFDARSPQTMLSAHLTAPPKSLAARNPSVPPGLDRLVMQLLAKDPAGRPSSAEVVLRALDDTAARFGEGTVGSRRAVLLGGAVLLLAGLVGYAVWRNTSVDARRSAEISAVSPASSDQANLTLAVLPFENIGGSADDEYFSDGLTDELAHALARLPGLQLAGRTSSFAFKGTTAPAQDIGRALDVEALVTGTVRRAGETIRVTAQLVSTTDGKVLKGAVSQSSSGDVFAVQDELTRVIVAALLPTSGDRGVPQPPDDRGQPVSVDVGRGTRDAEAYELYLKGRYYFHERGAANVGRSITYFQQAIARDPTFARAHAALALAYHVLPVYVPDPADSTAPLGKRSALAAVTLDSTLADGQLAMAIALEREFRFREAEVHYQATLRLEPSNQTAHQAYGFWLMGVGRTDEAITAEREATRLDPLAKSAGTALAEALIDARRFREAEHETRRILAIDSTFPLALYSLGVAQAFGGEPDSAVQTLERGVRLYPGLYTMQPRLLFAYAAAGRWTDVERMRGNLQTPGGDPSGGLLLAFADLVLGNREPILRLLTTRRGLRWWFDARLNGCNPLADPLWADARYRDLMGNLGVRLCPQARPWPVPARTRAHGFSFRSLTPAAEPLERPGDRAGRSQEDQVWTRRETLTRARS
jgi:TolB-like protein/tetratricopeptide (TPR) repeat protein